MRLSTGIYPFAEKYGDYAAAEKIKAWGFDCLDYGFFSKYGKAFLNGDHVEYATKLRAHLDEVGIVCNQAHAPSCKGAEWNEEDPKFLAVIKAMEAASILGAEHIIVHPQALHPFQEKKVGLVDYNEKFYATLQPYCEKFGVKIGVENVFSYNETFGVYMPIIGRPEEINELMSRLDERYFGFCWDIGHTVFAQYCPEDFILELDKGLVKCLHVHDNYYNSDAHTLPHLGRFNWRKIIQGLRAHGYQGDFTFETTNFIRRMPIELVDDAAEFMVKVGRRFVKKLERPIE